MSRWLKRLLLSSLLLAAPAAAQSDCGLNLRCGQVPWQLPVMPVLVSPTPFATSAPQVVQPTQESGYVPIATPGYCATPATLATSYQQQVANTNPYSYWPLDETAGTVAGDAVGGRNGTYTGATLNGYTLAGGPAPSFDGVNDRVFITGMQSVMNGGSFTLAFWMRVASNWAGSGTLAWFGDTQVFSLVRSGGSIVLTSGGSTASASASGNGSNWIHVAAVINRPVMGGQSGRLYINGVNVASANTAPGQFTSATTLYLATSGTANYFAGGLGHAAVWARALGQSEIALLANASPEAVPSPTPDGSCIPFATATPPLDMSGVLDTMATLQSLPVNQVGIENPQAGFDLYSGTGTFFSYVLGIQNVNLGIFTPIIIFIFWSFFSFIGIKVAFILLPIVSGLIGVLRRVIQLVLDFLPF